MSKTKRFKVPKIPFYRDCLSCQKCIACPIQWKDYMYSKHHTRAMKRHCLRILIVEVEVEEKVQTRLHIEVEAKEICANKIAH